MFGVEGRRKNEEARTYRIWWLDWGLEKDRFKHSPKNTVAVSDKWTEKVDCPKQIVRSSKFLYRRIYHVFQIACSNLVLPVISRPAPRAPRHQVLVQRVHV